MLYSQQQATTTFQREDSEIRGSDGPTIATQTLVSETSVNRPDKVTTKVVLELVQSQNYRCALTGQELTPETAQLDHIVPYARGGKHVRSNLQVLHKTVNVAKGTMDNEAFIEMCILVAENAKRSNSRK